MRTVALLALDGVVPFDLATPCEVLGRVRVAGIRQPYRLLICGATRRIQAGLLELRVRHPLADIAAADTVIVPGLDDLARPIRGDALAALRSAAASGARIASICSGAFVLAAAGLLDGLRATTHWLAAAELARRYPAVLVDPNVLFVDNGHILTSAGAAAGLDLCLHLVRRDYGAAAAADAARCSVMPLVREGGQAQFIIHEPPASGRTLAPLLRWLEQQLHRPLALAEIAHRGAMSIRTLTRRFQHEIGASPRQWLQAARIRRAQQLLESTDLSIEQVAAAVGFESSATFRARFRGLVGVAPQSYRRSFGQRPPSG